MKLVRYLRGSYAGRCLVEDDERARQLIAQGDAVLANDELEYMTREMTAAKPKRGRPPKPKADEGESPVDGD